MKNRLALIFLAICSNAFSAVWYVDVDNTSTEKDGTSWLRSFTDIQSAVDVAFLHGGGDIWIAEGVYHGIGDPVVSMKEDVHLYGGFAGLGDGGNETAVTQRDWSLHPTVIDGENIRRCVNGANHATLDGFTVTRGFHAGESGETGSSGGVGFGGGMCNLNVSPEIIHCSFIDNHARGGNGGDGEAYCCCSGALGGGGLGGAIFYENATISIESCTFSNNTAVGGLGGDAGYSDDDCPCGGGGGLGSGGAVYAINIMGEISGCFFSENEAFGGDGGVPRCFSPSAGGDSNGGAWSCLQSQINSINCVFVDNAAVAGLGVTVFHQYEGAGSPKGSGIYSNSSTMTLMNCTLTKNTGSGVVYLNSLPKMNVVNCIVWGNSLEAFSGAVSPLVNFSDIQGGFGSNLNQDPVFEDPDADNFQLALESPCIDTGTENGSPSVDYVGTPRPQCGGVDMGAYERVAPCFILHSADTNEDEAISAVEISRVVGFYNAGGYYVNSSTVDGYAPGVGSHNGTPHNSDFNPQNWQISAIELGRLVTFYNAGGYQKDKTSLDGYAPIIK